MANNNITHQPGSSDSQPGFIEHQHGTRRQPDDAQTQLSQRVHFNMDTMATLLKQLIVGGGSDMDHRPSRSGRKRRQSYPSSKSDNAEDDIEVIYHSKRPRWDDELSLSPSEVDIDTLIGVNALETKDADGAESTNGTANEDEAYLKSLEAYLNDEDPIGGKIQQNLANIPLKRWGISLSNDKLEALLITHTNSENCTEITVAKVNPEIWTQTNNFKRKTDLRVANAQQALQKATFAILKCCNTQLSKKKSEQGNLKSRH